MARIYTLVTPSDIVGHESRIRPVPAFEPQYQVYPGNEMPVFITDGNQVRSVNASWGISYTGKRHLTISMEKIMTRKPYNVWLRKYRCAIPANCFCLGTDQKPYLVRILKQRLFMIGGVCIPPAVTGDGWQFALLETEAADVLQTISDSMPVVLSPHKTEMWVTELTLLKVMQMADRSGDFWFDFYRVHHRILEPKWNERDLLKPIGISFREWQERNEKLNALDLKDDRFNRNNSKGRH